MFVVGAATGLVPRLKQGTLHLELRTESFKLIGLLLLENAATAPSIQLEGLCAASSLANSSLPPPKLPRLFSQPFVKPFPKILASRYLVLQLGTFPVPPSAASHVLYQPCCPCRSTTLFQESSRLSLIRLSSLFLVEAHAPHPDLHLHLPKR